MVPFGRAGFQRGMRDALGLGLGIFIYGVGFGLVAAQAAIGWGWALGISGAVYSGSAQLASVNLIQTGHVTLSTLAATILVINARYVLFGAALQPWLGPAGMGRAVGSLLLLGDGNWILTMKAIAEGEQDRAYLLGTGVPMFAGWMGGTLVGAVAGGILPDPHALGVDLMLPAFAAAMMTAMAKTRAAFLPIGVGAGAAILLGPWVGNGWAVIAAGLAGGLAAALRVKT
ncbi:branched-chain amino acid ABC transporter permease [Gemmobacter tilapiae]|uniref:Branched-chain amino acid ABC transporter permease n=2 Tax=Neogemmobacter tilapiae TaxID=875041 RepID=A0A918WNQ7_9RHOB|nr:branched-chain amino acid ABC transporter permease [Gemmobacter tilapiae]